MSVPANSDTWNLYDPDWQKKWDEHMRMANEQLALSPEERDLEALQYHTRAWHEAWISQFKNAPEYTNYLLDTLKRKAKANKLLWVHVDTSSVKTLEQANEIYHQANASFEEQITNRVGSLPTSKSSELFDSKSTKSYSSHIEHPNQKGMGFGGKSLATETIITMQEQDGQLNVCLSHLKDFGDISVYNSIENIASQLYHGGLKNKFPDPSKINWYIHANASAHAGHESFCNVKMDFADGMFMNPEFDHLEEVPKAVKHAEFNAAQDEICFSDNRPALMHGFDNTVQRQLTYSR